MFNRATSSGCTPLRIRSPTYQLEARNISNRDILSVALYRNLLLLTAPIGAITKWESIGTAFTSLESFNSCQFVEFVASKSVKTATNSTNFTKGSLHDSAEKNSLPYCTRTHRKFVAASKSSYAIGRYLSILSS